MKFHLQIQCAQASSLEKRPARMGLASDCIINLFYHPRWVATAKFCPSNPFLPLYLLFPPLISREESRLEVQWGGEIPPRHELHSKGIFPNNSSFSTNYKLRFFFFQTLTTWTNSVWCEMRRNAKHHVRRTAPTPKNSRDGPFQSL